MICNTCSLGVGLLAGKGLRAVEPRVEVPAYNTLTDAQETALGQRFAEMLEPSLDIVDWPILNQYLTAILQRLAARSQRPGLSYSIRLVNDHAMNAFSIAGGFVYVNRGLVRAMRQEDELVAAIAHEVGHIVGRHSVNQLLISFAARNLLDTVLKNLLRQNGVVDRVIQQLGGAATMLTLLRFSRSDEMEADLLGFYEMARAGWDPRGYLGLFTTLETTETMGTRSTFSAAKYLSTHPPSRDRHDAILREISEVKLAHTLRESSHSFHAFQEALELLQDPQGSAR